MRIYCFLVIALLSSFAAAQSNFRLHSASFSSETTIPIIYTCDGKDISPELNWSNEPKNTKSFVLVVNDPDAPSGNFYHWVLYNIPKNVTFLPQGITRLPTGIVEGKNSWGSTGYKGPCPPKEASHHYIFTIYALKNTLNLPAGADAQTVIKTMQNQVLDKAELITTYNH